MQKTNTNPIKCILDQETDDSIYERWTKMRLVGSLLEYNFNHGSH